MFITILFVIFLGGLISQVVSCHGGIVSWNHFTSFVLMFIWDKTLVSRISHKAKRMFSALFYLQVLKHHQILFLALSWTLGGVEYQLYKYLVYVKSECFCGFKRPRIIVYPKLIKLIHILYIYVNRNTLCQFDCSNRFFYPSYCNMNMAMTIF